MEARQRKSLHLYVPFFFRKKCIICAQRPAIQNFIGDLIVLTPAHDKTKMSHIWAISGRETNISRGHQANKVH